MCVECCCWLSLVAGFPLGGRSLRQKDLVDYWSRGLSRGSYIRCRCRTNESYTGSDGQVRRRLNLFIIASGRRGLYLSRSQRVRNTYKDLLGSLPLTERIRMSAAEKAVHAVELTLGVEEHRSAPEELHDN